MSEYPGIRRATVSYFAESITATAGLLVVMGVCCALSLWFFFSAGGPVAGYALFAYLGLCIYLGQRDLDDELRTVTDVSDSRFVAGLLGIVIVLYYNAVVFVATVLAGSLSYAGASDWALAVALLYPLYDAEMARQSVPLSVAGGIVGAFLLIAWLAEALEGLFGIDADGKTIDQIRRLSSTKSVLQDHLLEAYDRRWNRRTSH